MTKLLLLLAMLATLFPFSNRVSAQTSIPPGTVIPVQLSSSLKSQESKAGEKIVGRTMQDVPLPSGGKIRAGTKLIGQIVTMNAASAGQSAEMTLRFDRLDLAHHPVRISTNLRALASGMEVKDAQSPSTGADRGTPWNWINRNLIGGEVAYGDGGPVIRGSRQVGLALADGVLAPVRPNPAAGCGSEVSDNGEPQALWVFSSDACGVYGIDQVEITHAGRTDPVGEITLRSRKGPVKIRSGSGMLLRINVLDR